MFYWSAETFSSFRKLLTCKSFLLKPQSWHFYALFIFSLFLVVLKISLSSQFCQSVHFYVLLFSCVCVWPWPTGHCCSALQPVPSGPCFSCLFSDLDSLFLSLWVALFPLFVPPLCRLFSPLLFHFLWSPFLFFPLLLSFLLAPCLPTLTAFFQVKSSARCHFLPFFYLFSIFFLTFCGFFVWKLTCRNNNRKSSHYYYYVSTEELLVCCTL